MLEKELQAAFLHIQNKFELPGITPVILQYFTEQDKIYHLSYDADTLSKIALRMVDLTYKAELGLINQMLNLEHQPENILQTEHSSKIIGAYKKAQNLVKDKCNNSTGGER